MKKQLFYSLLCGMLFAPCSLFAASYEANDSPYITINGTPVMNGERMETPFCQEQPGETVTIKFELQNPDPTIEITSVEWDFGDGITREGTTTATHDYMVENWYDVKAILRGGFVYGDEELLTITASFSIRYCPPVIPQCLDLKIRPDQASTECGESYRLPYSIDEEAKIGKAFVVFEGGDKKTVTVGEDAMVIDLSALHPGSYDVYLEVEDLGCETTVKTRTFTLSASYPASIFTLKFNNVLAVYQNGQGGNHYGNFKAFQWYKNGLPIQGATKSIFHSENIFTPGDEYYVLLTDEKDNTSATCPFVIPEDLPDYTPVNEEPKAVKSLINQRMVIQYEGKTFNMYGQRVQ